jgi:hypothetical protein
VVTFAGTSVGVLVGAWVPVAAGVTLVGEAVGAVVGVLV